MDEEHVDVVPIDLDIMDNNSANNIVTKQALIISGPNGGGKTLGDSYHMKNNLHSACVVHRLTKSRRLFFSFM